MRTFVIVAICSRLVCAQIIQHVDDLSIFGLLAPCASSAVSEYVNTLTDSTNLGCGTAEAELQSCICSQSEVSSQVTTNVSEGIRSICGNSASDDQWSASRVLKKYCSPSETITFSTPTTNIVTQYITALEKMSFIPQCVSSGISWVVMYSASSNCPESASLYAPCVCSKKDVVNLIRSELSSKILDRCDNREDLELARQIYAEYCAMNDGTTSFAPLGTPPGDMTYHITALSQYSSLPKCARIAVSSAVLDKTESNCATGPQAVASCVCLKEGMLQDVYGSMSTDVGLECGFTNKDAAFSAIDVLNYYCSAAENKVFEKVTDTATQAYPTASHGAGTGSDGARETGKGGGGKAEGGGGSSASPGLIAGAAVGGIAGIALIIGAVFFLVRRRRRASAVSTGVTTGIEDHNKPELDSMGHPASPGELDSSPSPGLASRKPVPHGTSAISTPWSGPPAELDGSSTWNRSLPESSGLGARL